MEVITVEELSKPELRTNLKATLQEVSKLRDTVSRLLRQNNAPVVVRHTCHTEDSVPTGWAEQHKIEIPRSDGIFESTEAWVRIKHGVIIGAGLKNQSILNLAISLDLLDQGAERDGRMYRDWRAAFFSRLDPEKSGGKGSDNPDAWSKEDRYSKLLHRVGKDYISAMDAIVALKPKARHLAAFHGPKNATKEEIGEAQGAFVAAFESVTRVMAEINREADEAIRR